MGTDTLFPERRTRVSFESELPGSPSQPCIVVIAGTELGQRIDLDDADVVIGRAENSRLFINSDLVSRHHATIARIAGRYVLKDEGSTNGTFVNDQRLTEPRALDDGDTVKIGRTVLKYTESPVEVQYLEHVMGLATKDSLTELYNKRRFDELLPAETARAAQNGTPLSLILFDIDHFKSINDTYGHPTGDAVLRAVAIVAGGCLREGDFLSRVGGEEFALLVPEPLAGAVGRAETVRRAIEHHALPIGDKTIRVTVSLGVAELARGETQSAFYQRADALLYESKNSGRNRVSS
ncbi:MAG TPA: GGDEF domain-containing protein [Polyangiaceae bacterium]